MAGAIKENKAARPSYVGRVSLLTCGVSLASFFFPTAALPLHFALNHHLPSPFNPFIRLLRQDDLLCATNLTA